MKGAPPSGAKVFCRCYGTLLAAVLACVGAETWAIAGVMVACGAVFDLCRSFIAPDLTMGETALAESIVLSVRDPAASQTYRSTLRRWTWPIYGIWVGYTVLFSLVQPMLSPDVARAYLHFFEPLYRVCGVAFVLARNHPPELLARGYADRALVVAHMYSFIWLMFVFSLGSNILLRANCRSHPAKLTPKLAAVLQSARWQVLAGPALLCVGLALLLYVFVSYGLTIDWTHRTTTYSWDVQDNNVPFLYLMLLLFGAEFLFSMIYSYAILYRAGLVFRRAGQSPNLTAVPV